MSALVLLLSLVAAHAEEPTAPVTGATTQPSDQQTRLATAVQHYLDGDPGVARADIQALLGLGPELEPGVRRDALAWLGDILYSEEGERAARNAFETLLAEDPSYSLDSFQHPPEVVSYFEKVKQEFSAPPVRPVEPPVVKPQPFPVLSLVPGGLYYYMKGKPLVGATLTTLQVGCLAGSVALYVERSSIPDELEPGREADVERSQTLRTLNWTVAAVGWSALVIPIFVETSLWGSQRSTVRVSTDGRTLQVGGSF